MSDPIIVIGAGQAAASFIAKLRSEDYQGAITLIGDEQHLPYQRPPLSKKYLLGDMAVERLALRPQSWYEENHITLKTGVRVSQIDREAKAVTLDDGTVLNYSKLMITTGSTPFRLPAVIGGHLPGVYTLRSLHESGKIYSGRYHGTRSHRSLYPYQLTSSGAYLRQHDLSGRKLLVH